MLELQKFVLLRVSDDEGLFRKELRKSFRWLNTDEIVLLREWVLKTFGNIYSEIINEALNIVV